MAESGTQQLFDLWKKQMDEASQAWLRMMQQGQPAADPQALWRPFMDQTMAAWSKVMAQGPGSVSPDLLAQWKQFLDQWIAAWAKVLEQAMGTEAFAQALGKQLEMFLDAAGPWRKAGEQQMEASLAGLGMPSRSQVTALAKHVVQLEEKLDALDDRLDGALRRLDEMGHTMTRRLDTLVGAVDRRLDELAGTLKRERA